MTPNDWTAAHWVFKHPRVLHGKAVCGQHARIRREIRIPGMQSQEHLSLHKQFQRAPRSLICSQGYISGSRQNHITDCKDCLNAEGVSMSTCRKPRVALVRHVVEEPPSVHNEILTVLVAYTVGIQCAFFAVLLV